MINILKSGSFSYDMKLKNLVNTLSGKVKDTISYEEEPIQVEWINDEVPIFGVIFILFKCGLIEECIDVAKFELEKSHNGSSTTASLEVMVRGLKEYHESGGNIQIDTEQDLEKILSQGPDNMMGDIFK